MKKWLSKIMSKAVSFYDWELGFKRKTHSVADSKERDDEVNSIGIPKTTFKSFITEWKKKNLS
jgi:hypothetical protein